MSKFLLFLFVIFILILSVRGLKGAPNSKELNQERWKDDGPFELSPERGRFALLYSVVEDKSFFFSLPVARFALPDLAYQEGRFVSRFAPTVSFLAIPGYLLGKVINLSQVGSFLVILLFGFLNLILVRAIAIRLGAKPLAASIGSLAFIFASPAFAYAVSLYQHHVSTFIILLSIYLVMRYRNLWSFALIWFLCATSITIDYPNLFLMFPIGVVALTKLVSVKFKKRSINFNFRLIGLTTFLVMILPLAPFLWFNKISFGNPFQLSGTVPGVKDFDEQGRPLAPQNINPEDVEKYLHPETQEKFALRFFQTRDMLNGLFIHLTSPDRGVVFYTPVMLFGFLGILAFYKNKKREKYFPLLISIILVNLILYSMWGDPWGGWAFGSRYLIPSYAIMAIFVAVFLTNLKRKRIWLPIFFTVLAYSIFVNTLGALTTSRIPPKVEAVALQDLSGRIERYSFDRNWEFLTSVGTKSFVYNTYLADKLKPMEYFGVVASSITLLTGGLTLLLFRKK